LFKLKQNIEKLSDKRLLQHYKDTHDTVYLGELYKRYMPLVYGSCLKYLKNRANAQDAVMKIFEELLEKTLNYAVQNFKSWLYILTKNYCLMHLRRESKHKTISFEDNFMELADDFHLDKVMEDELRVKALEDCIKALSAEQHASVTKFYIENLSYVEICEIMSYDISKVKSYIQNGKRNLKLCLERKGIKSAAF
jgi:RNA polymerase sigma-70 factor (ECF subfamily)